MHKAEPYATETIMSRIPWRDRIARAGQLAENIPSAAEVMRFYQALLVQQESWCRPGELSGALIEDRFPHLLDFPAYGGAPVGVGFE